VSLFDAVRFTNWLSNNQPTGAEGPGTTETGSYTITINNVSHITNVTQNSNATWVIPTNDEWYKAAYYNPATGSYYQYPYSSNTVPLSAPPGNAPNTGNFYDPTTGYALTGSTSYSGSQNYLTDVGSYTASASPYGAFDMGGDVFQWAFGSVWGGAWTNDSSNMASSYRRPGGSELFNIGFRVALVPEPSTLALLMLGAGGIFIKFGVRKSEFGMRKRIRRVGEGKLVGRGNIQAEIR